ncbi:class I SAM-dependent methyltransferase [Enteractinococcus fodinae]|uniref:SAM-dependent methyltransferase n=1 Tax=Enteractinococcus fodinae TaxID=684663 RepID=A0ABU2B623_9MICC|nr:class I SAM-dependent methyltransferase [Enteractinococcus fodinae]MDR7348213.1 SAM-dependent methyltransferase [Enteractinococcus fodinae]
MDEIGNAYDAEATAAERLLGTAVSPDDPDRAIIEPWANTVAGPILDVGSGTGRWTGHLVQRGHDVTGLEPAERLLRIARKSHPAVRFCHGSISDLVLAERRWVGILAWYSVIHMGPDELPTALATLQQALDPNGTMLLSFFSGPHLQAFDHPVAVAYRWPMADMRHALTEAGFEVIDQHGEPSAIHAHMIARQAR